MRKKVVVSAVFCYIATLFASVCAQETAFPSPMPTESSPNLLGGILAAVGLIIFLAIIFYGGYRMIRKWSRPQSD